MTVFANYARYYDLLYKDKDYKVEVDFIDGLLKKFGNAPTSILELGCGTAKHALILASKGYSIIGIDQSEEMLKAATIRRQNEYPNARVELIQGDACSVRIGKTVDAVISLFHVISYQTKNEELVNTFKTAAEHLTPGGVFLFDCWYGPTVLTDPPVVRVKRMENNEISVVRIAEPIVYPNENVVNVNYTIIIKDKKSGSIEELQETHKMRYLFQPEIELLLKMTGFEFVFGKEWLKDNAPGFASWGAVFCGKKIKERSLF